MSQLNPFEGVNKSLISKGKNQKLESIAEEDHDRFNQIRGAANS